MRLLITGAAGFLGTRLVVDALGAGHDVHGTWWRRRASEAAEMHRVDILDATALDVLTEQLRPDVVVNTAYDPAGGPATSTGAARVAAAARSAESRLIHLSTDVVFGGTSTIPYTENDRCDPVHAYGQAKRDAEEAVIAAHPEALLIRTSLIYGNRSHQGAQEALVLQAAADPGSVTFFTDEIRSPISVIDLSAAILELSAGDARGVLHLAGPEPIDRLTLARRIATHLGHADKPLRGAPSPTDGPLRPLRVVLNSTRAAGLLQTEIRSSEVVLAE